MAKQMANVGARNHGQHRRLAPIASRQNQQRRETANVVKAKPLLRLGDDVGAYDEAKLPARVQARERLERENGAAFPRELELDGVDGATRHAGKRRLRERHAELEGGEPFAEGVAIRRDDEHVIDLARGENPRAGEHVTEVRRVETSAKDGDAHGSKASLFGARSGDPQAPARKPSSLRT